VRPCASMVDLSHADRLLGSRIVINIRIFYTYRGEILKDFRIKDRTSVRPQQTVLKGNIWNKYT
jgi:hypothetical protein